MDSLLFYLPIHFSGIEMVSYINTHHPHNHFTAILLFHFYNHLSIHFNHAYYIVDEFNNRLIHFLYLSELLGQFKV